MSLTEMAWAAGFFDGEGTTHTVATGTYAQLFVSVQQSETSTLERLRDVLGVGYIYALAPRATNLAVRPQFRWQTTHRKQGMYALGLMWPYLSQPKRDQATRALATVREVHNKRTARAGTRTAHATHEGASS